MRTHAYRPRLPLGLTLLSRGIISKSSLEAALTLQQERGGPLGRCLQEVCSLPEAAITSAIAEQWNTPAFQGKSPALCAAELLSAPLARELRVLPVHWNPVSRRLLLGFSTSVEYTSISAIETVLECQVSACIVNDSLFHSRDNADAGRSNSIFRFAAMTPAERVAVITSYAERTGCSQLRAARTADLYWIRLAAHNGIDLLLDISRA